MPRKTSQREAIQAVFADTRQALRIDEILQAGRKQAPSLNQATVYRNLKLLVEAGWLHQIQHPELGVLYERAGKAHHHYFHCRHCDRVYEMPGCGLNTDFAPQGFVIEDHEIFLTGACPACVPA